MLRRSTLGLVGALLCSWMFYFVSAGTFVTFTFSDVQQVQAQDEDIDIEEDSAPKQKSYLAWLFGALGWMYSIIFLGLSFVLVALFFKNFMSLRRDQIIPDDMVVQFEAHLEERRFQEAYEMTKNDDSYLGQMLAAGLAKIASGYDQAIEAMQETSESESMRLEHGLSYIALIASIAPMVGLMGTVQGMIASFSVIANSSTAPKPAELAEGISTALFTTLVGLVLAIPALCAYGILKNRLARLILEVSITSENLLSKVLASATGKK